MLSTVLLADKFDKISIKGNAAFFESTLFDAVGLQSSSTTLLKKEYNTTNLIPSDTADDLLDFYYSKGYYKCLIDYQITNNELSYHIKEDKPIRVKSLKINSTFNLKKFQTMAVDDIFDADKFMEMKQLIRRHLDENGYPKTKIVSNAIVNIEPYEAYVEINITTANKSKIKAISYPQLEKISKNSINDKLEFKIGDYFDIRDIEKSRENLYMSDMFSNVQIEIDDNESDDENLTLSIKLDKGKQKSIKVSLGYSSDEGPRFKFSWIDKNAFNDFRRVETSVKLMRDSQASDATLFLPNLLGMPFEDKVSIEQYRWPYLGYSEKQIANQFRFSFDAYEAKNFLGLKTEHGVIDAEVESEYIKNQSYITNAIMYQYLLDKRDSKLDATSGYLIDANIEFANNILASSLNYVKSELEAREIISFPYTSKLSNLTLALKGKIGVIDDLKKSYIPIFKRFFAGGSFSNRGYAFNKMGPTDNAGNFVGAKTLIDASAEAIYKINQKFSGVTFFDTTLLGYQSFSIAEKFNPSIGIGMRYETGVGPLRFDIGVPIGEDKRNPVFHISFGQSF